MPPTGLCEALEGMSLTLKNFRPVILAGPFEKPELGRALDALRPFDYEVLVAQVPVSITPEPLVAIASPRGIHVQLAGFVPFSND